LRWNADLAEYDNGAAPTSPSREYIYFGTRLAATRGGSTYQHGDHLSVRVSTDGTTGSSTYGQVIGQQAHYPYGETWYASNTTSKFIFTSYERDPESSNDYAMARFYINRFGRFCSADPLLGSPKDPQSWNRYVYVRNDPINIMDPSGQGWLSWLVRIILVIVQLITNIPLGALTVGIPGGPISVGTPSTFPGGSSGIDWHVLLPANNPHSMIMDWSPAAHDQMLQDALGPCGVGQDLIAKIQAASRAFDDRSQDPSMSYAHRMSNGKQVNQDGTLGQSAGEALDQSNKFIVDHMIMAQNA